MEAMPRARVRVAHETAEPGISYAIARLERAIRAEIGRRVAPYGLTTLQYTALSVLHRHGAPLSNAQLARRAYMRPQSMSEVIDVLERLGLIKRDQPPRHRRSFPARLTARGRRVLAACDAEVIELEDSMLAGLDDLQRRQFAETVKTAVRALRAGFPREPQPFELTGVADDLSNGTDVNAAGARTDSVRMRTDERSSTAVADDSSCVD
jgi:DNA-binding MarR family transcriptional regulator